MAEWLNDGFRTKRFGCHILGRKELTEHTIVALPIPVGQMSIVNSVLITVFALNMYRRMIVMHVEGLDSHLQHHNHQKYDGIEVVSD